MALLDREAKLIHGFSDVGVGHGTEQTAVNTSLGGDGNGGAIQLFLESLGIGQTLSLSLLKVSATGFELGDSGLGGALGVTLGDQEVAAVAVLDLDHIAQIAEVMNVFKQNNLHVDISPGLLIVGVGKEGEEAGTLDRGIELALVDRLRAGQTGGHDLAIFLDEIAQRVDILVIDLLNVSSGKAAELLPLEEGIALGGTAVAGILPL